MQIFSRNKSEKPAKHHPYLALDLEDDSKGNFLIGVIYGEKMTHHGHGVESLIEVEQVFLGEKGYVEMCDFINKLTAREAYLIGYNTDYDLGVIDEGIKIKRLYAKGRFIQAKTKKGSVIRDLSNHYNKGTSLEDLMPLVGMKKDEPTDKEDEERRAGIINEAWIKRCRNDAKATWKLTKQLEDFYTDNGAVFKATIGSTSLDLFKRRFFTHFWIRPEDKQWLNEYERKAYFGGRTEGFIKKGHNVWSYDINSAYVAAMKKHVYPDPTTARYHGGKRSNPDILKEYMKKYQGIAEIKIHIPRMKIPPLPYRFKIEGEEKLIFPVGIISGWWTFVEIENALQVGCKIKVVYRFIHYQRSFPYFKEFAEWVWNERQKHPKDKDPFTNLSIKLLGNSLYGKWAQQNDVSGIYVHKEDMPEWMEKNEAKVRKRAAEGKPALPELVGDELRTHFYIHTKTPGLKENAKHAFPILSAYVTAFVRVFLYKEMVKHKSVYSDTDCVKFIGTINEIKNSEKLGGWGFEDKKSGWFEFFAPKYYRIGKQIMIKGIPKKVLEGKRGSFIEDENKVTAFYDKPNKWRESERRGLKPSQWEEICKVAEKKDKKRVWFEDGTSEAIEIKEEDTGVEGDGEKPSDSKERREIENGKRERNYV